MHAGSVKIELLNNLQTPPHSVNLISVWLRARRERGALQSARHYSQTLGVI